MGADRICGSPSSRSATVSGTSGFRCCPATTGAQGTRTTDATIPHIGQEQRSADELRQRRSATTSPCPTAPPPLGGNSHDRSTREARPHTMDKRTGWSAVGDLAPGSTVRDAQLPIRQWGAGPSGFAGLAAVSTDEQRARYSDVGSPSPHASSCSSKGLCPERLH